MAGTLADNGLWAMGYGLWAKACEARGLANS